MIAHTIHLFSLFFEPHCTLRLEILFSRSNLFTFNFSSVHLLRYMSLEHGTVEATRYL